MTEFKSKVYDVVAQIPEGRVMSYSQIAAICGTPTAARIVGQLAHYGPPDLPWHRVVRKDGGLAGGFPGGMQAQQKMLEDEGIEIKDFKIVDLQKYVC